MSVDASSPPVAQAAPDVESVVPAEKELTAREEQEQTLAEWAAHSALQTAMLLLLYVLSIGPLYWHWYGSRFAGESPILRIFYQPLVALAELVSPFGEWLDWYVGLWIS